MAFDIASYGTMSVFVLVVAVGSLLTFFLMDSVNASTSGYVAPDTNECQSHTDCDGLCVSMNGQPKECMCFEDSDCSTNNCQYNRCI